MKICCLSSLFTRVHYHAAVCVGQALFLDADGRDVAYFVLFWRERADVPPLTSGTWLRDDVTHTVTMATTE